ncbi:hypothetical protein [Candidatus Villigracilis affinis]|uniref:hypothetical protein n=1 Tax=Candidatus Villigracilis affinis TaxID=3140682 RepID=UPI002A1B564F|nr:hypothetical protein [Anaerolineales bacterium]
MDLNPNDNLTSVGDKIGKKRGGQLGNNNAFKHGFYSGQFKQAERMGLSQVENADLTNEIELLRVQLRRYLEAETTVLDQMDFETRLQALRAVSLAAETLTRLIRMQALLNVADLETKDKQESAPPKEVFS